MDISTIIGIVAGLGLVLYGISDGGNLASFINIPSLAIVLGGTFGALMVQYPLDMVLKLPKITKHAFRTKSWSPSELITLMVGLAQKARREGLLALEEEAANIDDEFLQKGIQLVVDGTDPELVRNILEVELNFLEERHKVGQNMYLMLGATAPGFGMIGTLIGLIIMLGQLDKPETVGPAMAVALITTLYGSILANLFFNPLGGKLALRSAEEILMKEVIIEGILSIQAGENPRIVEEKLKAFLAPANRESKGAGNRGEAVGNVVGENA
ncbi:MAG: motility protein A [Firmicutes bacterium]|nr:motility protein A [Bacillota bacterium]